MIDLLTGPRSAMCDGVPRRDLLRIGLGLGASGLFPAMGWSESMSGYVRDKSVVLLFLAGGPSQYETFDPKPGGLENFTSITGHIDTALTGVHFSSYLPKLAKLADRLSIVRSFQTKHAEHNGAHKQILTGDLTVGDGQPIKEPGLGAAYARAAGAVNERTGLPRHVLIPPTTRYPGAGSGFAGAFESVVEGVQPSHLGPSFAPLQLFAPMPEGEQVVRNKKNAKRDDESANPFLESLEPHVPLAQLDARVDLLRQLEQLQRRLDSPEIAKADIDQRRAVDLLHRDTVRQAFDLNRESPATREAYETAHFRNWNCDDRSRFLRDTPSIGFSLGRQLLLARRLCEAGCGFITVVNANWDFHARKGIPNIPEGMGVFAPPLDHAVSAFLEDVRQRGLEDKILLVITGEFGRTGLDGNAGRHHWPRICPLVFAGGGLKHGQVIGASDKRGGQPTTEPITIDDLHATILHTLLDVGRLRLDPSLPPRVLDRAQRGTPIRELFS